MTKRAKRIWAIVGAVFIALAIYAWFFGTATMFVWEARQIAKQAPVVNIVPVQLPNLSVSNSPGHIVSVGDYEFEIPWADFEEKTTPKSPYVKSFVTKNGSALAVFAGASESKPITEGEKEYQATFETIFGHNASLSNYTFTKNILQVTPEQVRLLAPRRELVTRSVSLTIKSITLPSAAGSGIYFVETPAFLGFQYGNPEKSDKSVVDLFPKEGRVEFVFSKRGGGSVPQPEINRIVQSLRRKATVQQPALRIAPR